MSDGIFFDDINEHFKCNELIQIFLIHHVREGMIPVNIWFKIYFCTETSKLSLIIYINLYFSSKYWEWAALLYDSSR